MLTFLEVKGAATEASAMESEMPKDTNLHKKNVLSDVNKQRPNSMINVEKQTSVGGFESSTVVATISTHDYLPAVI